MQTKLPIGRKGRSERVVAGNCGGRNNQSVLRFGSAWKQKKGNTQHQLHQNPIIHCVEYIEMCGLCENACRLQFHENNCITSYKSKH